MNSERAVRSGLPTTIATTTLVDGKSSCSLEPDRALRVEPSLSQEEVVHGSPHLLRARADRARSRPRLRVELRMDGPECVHARCT